MWNWQQKKWPNWKYEKDNLTPFERAFSENTGELKALWEQVSLSNKNGIYTELLSNEITNTSEIEGEHLHRDSLRSSIRKNLGLQLVGGKKREQLFADVVTEILENPEEVGDEKKFNKWNQYILNLGKTPKYRNDQMEIVSGAIGKEKVHFVAPGPSLLKREMKIFFYKLKLVNKKDKKILNPILQTSIFHLYFLAIHPYDDGNGRLARLLSYKMLLQGMGNSIPLCLSEAIAENKKKYYQELENTNKTLEIDTWLQAFGKIILSSQEKTISRLKIIISKEKFFKEKKESLNNRQEKVVRKIFDLNNEFNGGLSSKNYQSITKASPATATRDLSDLVKKGVLESHGAKKYRRYRINRKLFI